MSIDRILLGFFLLICSTYQLSAQSINTEFGKNRVQFHDDFDKWWMYETENFITYWYGKGRNIAQSVIQLAELDHDDIQSIMEHRINDKIEIIVYLDVSDLRQSNIGLDETFESNTGVTKIIGSKMFVYFDGNHRNLRKQIRKGIATVYLNAMFSGTSLQEIVKSSVNLKTPQWFGDGLIAYAGSNWDYLIEDELRDLWSREDRNYKDFEVLSDYHSRVAGHSFWYFMDQAYGKSTISNLLYLTRINRKIENSFLFVLGVPMDDVLEDWKGFYDKYYETENDKFEELTEELELSNKPYAPVSQLALSPDGTELLYSYNDIGKYQVRLRNLETGEEKSLFKYGYRNALQETDYNYPLISWHPDGNEVTFVYEHRDRMYLQKMSLETGESAEQIIPELYQRIYSISYLNDLDYIFSANTDGFSDLYIYQSKDRQTVRLTEDFYDDLDASYVTMGDQQGILFSSNRTDPFVENQKLDTILPIENFDIFFFPFEENDEEMYNITYTPEISERYPYVADGRYISYLDHNSGIKNRIISPDGDVDSRIPNSNLSRNIIRHNSVKGSSQHIYTLYDSGAYRVYLESPKWDQAERTHTTLLGARNSKETTEELIGIGVLDVPDDIEEMKDDYLFQSEYEDPPELEPIEDEEVESTNIINNLLSLNSDDEESPYAGKVVKFVNARAVAGRTKFKLEDFSTKMDNQVLFEGLESYTGEDKELTTAPIGPLLKARLKDLFEDYTIEGGVRIPTSLNGSEYYVLLDDNKKLLDKRYALYRKSETNRLPETFAPVEKLKRVSLLGMYRVKYPFDIHRSLRVTGSLRFDKLFQLNSNELTSSTPVSNEKRISIKTEYVFDNTIHIDQNLRHGTRYKVYAEFINRFNIQFREFEFDASKGFTGILGADARHYVPVLEHSVLALRGAAATSFGSEKILYYVGGVENWIAAQFNDNIPLPENKTFAYKAIAPHLRGFKHNIRNGNTFIVANTELRVPLFKYLTRKTLRSNFLKNIQLVGFFDLGTAWHGASPTTDDNPINSIVIEQAPVIQIKVNYFRDPLVMGYGLGLRSQVFGYFVRVDYAWGIESRTIQDPKLYFAVGTDF